MRRQVILMMAAVAFLSCNAKSLMAQQCSRPYLVQQSFPTAGPTETSWQICWQTQPGWGLIITSAHFRKSPSAPWMRVFWDARVSDIFVPYHPGSPRYYDLSVYGFGMTTVSAADCPTSVGGSVLANVVCKEVHDRGLAWKDDASVRRGQELVLWSAVDAANYNYIIEWTFRDDGVVVGRLGATAVNLPGMPFTAHTHNGVWRLDIDLNGFWGDAVHLGTHHENLPGNSATDTDPVILNEAGLQWDDLAFNSANVHDATLKNSHGHSSSYHLIPVRSGTGRNAEAFTKNDFWVTRYNWAEMRPASLPSYISPAQSVSNSDIVLWYWGTLHHIPRDEDGEIVEQNWWRGEAHLMWTGFMLKPHNLFDRTPLFP